MTVIGTDKEIIETLLKDEIFIGSMESELGKIQRLWADWDNDAIVYEFLNGDTKYSRISDILDFLVKNNYMEQFYN